MVTRTENPLKGKVVLVTGGAQGLGKAICEELVEGEANVILADIQEEKGQGVADRLKESAGSAAFRKLDLGSADDIRQTLLWIKEKYGRLDAIINNAGIDFTKPISDLTVQEWDMTMAINLRGPFIVAKYGLEMMKEQGSGHIINIISTASLRAWPEASVYHATKWGLRGFTHALFTEARKIDVKVTGLIAGGMKTPFLLDRFPDIAQETLQDPREVAVQVRHLLATEGDSVVPELMVIPMGETSWP